MNTPLSASCPSCGVVLERTPLRKSICPHCQEVIYVKRNPGEGFKRLMNQAQADKSEEAWRHHFDLKKIERDVCSAGIDIETFHSAVRHAGGNIRQAAHSLLAPTAIAGNRHAALLLATQFDSIEGAEYWLLLLVEMDLARLAKQGVRSVQLTAGQAHDRLCPACKPLDKSIISVEAGARAVIPVNCTCLTKGLLQISGWIKRSDGSRYIDRQH